MSVFARHENVDLHSGLTVTVKSLDRHYTVNMRATWLLIKVLAKRWPATGRSVVALTSDHTMNNLPYGATKAVIDRIVLAAAYALGCSSRARQRDQFGPGRHWLDDTPTSRRD